MPAPRHRRARRTLEIPLNNLAYLDPGSGSLLLQALLAGAAGIAVVAKLFGQRLLGVLTFWKKKPARPDSATEAADPALAGTTSDEPTA